MARKRVDGGIAEPLSNGGYTKLGFQQEIGSPPHQQLVMIGFGRPIFYFSQEWRGAMNIIFAFQTKY